MTPILAVDNAPHAVLAQMRVAPRDMGDALSLSVKLSHFKNLCRVGFRHAALLAANHGRDVAAASTAHAVPHIVSLRSGVQMLRVHARRIIAMVKRMKTAKRFAPLDLQRDTVSEECLVIVGDNTVALAIQSSEPRPTLVLAAGRHHGPELARNAAKRLNFADTLENLSALAARFWLKVNEADNRDARHWRQGAVIDV